MHFGIWSIPIREHCLWSPTTAIFWIIASTRSSIWRIRRCRNLMAIMWIIILHFCRWKLSSRSWLRRIWRKSSVTARLWSVFETVLLPLTVLQGVEVCMREFPFWNVWKREKQSLHLWILSSRRLYFMQMRYWMRNFLVKIRKNLWKVKEGPGREIRMRKMQLRR